MKQIYTLLQTIEDDKQAVAACEKYLHYLKGQLSVHEEALTRITSVPTINNTTSLKKASRVRITQENCKELGIEVGDTVEIVVSGDWDFKNGAVCEVTDIDDDDNLTFLRFVYKDDNNHYAWYCFNRDCAENDELYLIKQ